MIASSPKLLRRFLLSPATGALAGFCISIAWISAPAEAGIQVIDNFARFVSVIMEHIEAGESEQALVAIDIDKVLLHRVENEHQQTDGYNVLHSGGRHYIVYRSVAEWVNELALVADVICLTARNEVYGLAELAQAGLQLSGSTNFIEPESGELSKITALKCRYNGNIIYTNHQTKGAVLLAFVNLRSGIYSSIFFIDDSEEQVQSVNNTLEKEGKKVMAFHLTGENPGDKKWKLPAKIKGEAFFHHDD
ncbi:DUF2608 domain-containing protein [Endozoicomonadaceae bacterium StTr2]